MMFRERWISNLVKTEHHKLGSKECLFSISQPSTQAINTIVYPHFSSESH